MQAFPAASSRVFPANPQRAGAPARLPFYWVRARGSGCKFEPRRLKINFGGAARVDFRRRLSPKTYRGPLRRTSADALSLQRVLSSPCWPEACFAAHTEECDRPEGRLINA
jgi:hypothetical protein